MSHSGRFPFCRTTFRIVIHVHALEAIVNCYIFADALSDDGNERRELVEGTCSEAHVIVPCIANFRCTAYSSRSREKWGLCDVFFFKSGTDSRA